MGINGINDYSSIINNFRIPSIPSVSVEEVKRQDELLSREKEQNLRVSTLEDVSLPARSGSNAALEDISLTFNKGDDFGYIGKDSDIYSLDVENAISDMQKDTILKQYQFFVGNTNAGPVVNNADGVVIPKLY